MFSMKTKKELSDIEQAVANLNTAAQITEEMPVNSFLKAGDDVLVKIQKLPSGTGLEVGYMQGEVLLFRVSSTGGSNPAVLIPTGDANGSFVHQLQNYGPVAEHGTETVSWILSQRDSVARAVRKSEYQMIDPRNPREAIEMLQQSLKLGNLAE